MIRLAHRLSLAVVLLASVSSAAQADTWYEHYAAAEEALADEEWLRAVEQVTKALEKRGDSGVRVRTYGMKFTSYFPYLKLGIAYYELGRLDAAIQAFETEQRLGAIQRSEGDLRVLETYRTRAESDRREAEEMEAARVAGIVADNLAEARTLEDAGQLEDAIAAVGVALAVAPDDGDAVEMLERLRKALSERDEALDRAARIASLVTRGRDRLAAGEPAEAASVLSQALSLGETEEARALFDSAQRALRSAVETERQEETTRRIQRAISDARELEASGRIAEALDRLQSVLAIEPPDSAAKALEQRLLTARERADETQRRGQAVARLLREGESALATGDIRAALTAANRVLSIEPDNSEALEHLARAYRALSMQLLGDSARQTVPPALSFVDSRRELEDGSLAELVERPKFVLRGLAIDDSPVDITFFDDTDREIEGSHKSRALGDLYLTEFQVAQQLAAGASTLRVVASDSEGLSSSSEYTVVYQRPFSRSPWLVIVLVSGSLTILAGALAHRSRRRRQLRRRRFNPYVAGSPVLDESLFFGREQLLDRILQTLHNNSLLLHGERRIGKTTLQHQLKKRLEALDDPNFEFYPVYIDLQGTPEDRFFATLAEEIFEELGPRLAGLESCMPLSGGYGYRDFVTDLRRILKRLLATAAKQVRLVLLIDEVDELNSYDPRINQKLRSLFMKSFAENLVAVVSGVSIKRAWDREASPWYNFFEEIDVGPFRPEDARQLVAQPIYGIVAIDEDALERILEVTECRPYRIQKLCMRLVNRAYEKNRRRITRADVDSADILSESVLP